VTDAPALAEECFLQGPQERRYELLRALRIFAELLRGVPDAPLRRPLRHDSPDVAVEHVRETAMRRFGLTHGPRLRRRWWLRE
jgi:hypothetical protein